MSAGRCTGVTDQQQEPILEARDICFGYDQTLVLDHIGFSIYPGDFVGLVGSNGAGKSTLVRLLLGLLPPDSGELLLGGRPQREHRVRVGYVAQKAGVFNAGFPATVFEVVSASLYSDIGLFRRPGPAHRAAVAAALEQVDLSSFERRAIGELSGGQQQRVFIARALAAGTGLLFLDEPTANVDIRTENEIYQLLRELNRVRGLTIVLVSHDIGAVTAYANRMFCLGADGFFEHCIDEGCHENFYRRLYGYEVVPHIHHRPDGRGGFGHV